MTQAKRLTLKISEIFCSLAGEGGLTGKPMAFVRLSGCNLRCLWCDTTYALEGGEELTAEQIVARISGFGLKNVLVTGGEPLAQTATRAFLKLLIEKGFEVALETNGSFSIEGVDKRVCIIMDIKCPSSGVSESNLWENIGGLGEKDEVKFVIADRADFEYAKEAVLTRLRDCPAAVWFGPAWGKIEPGELAGWIIAEKLPVRMYLQLHKAIGIK